MKVMQYKDYILNRGVELVNDIINQETLYYCTNGTMPDCVIVSEEEDYLLQSYFNNYLGVSRSNKECRIGGLRIIIEKEKNDAQD